ncbi:MAG: protein kinase [Candidatus Aminicenantes bacterium]|nr:protein kinase [Candidatus Aminicenantes bacterium]
MRCTKCRADNPPETNFCGKCGSPLIPSEEFRFMPTKTLLTSMRDIAVGSTFAGRYRIIEEIGKGGMGKVFKVLDTKVDEKVALKLLNIEFSPGDKILERFRNELKLARKISHRYVCRMFDLGEAEGIPYLTMEYVSGEDLKSLLRRIGQFTVSRSVFIAKQVCEGLAEAHRIGIVHRDLKPQNIMVDRDGNVRIMDFGISRSLRTKGITDTGEIFGTPEYMSPESLEGRDPDRRTDIYSLGIILFEMLTGKVPFDGDTPLNVALKQKTEIPPDPQKRNPQITDDLSHLILKCLNKDPGKRYADAVAILSDLKKIESSLPNAERIVSEKRPLTSREITFKFSLKKAILPIAAVVVLALVVFGWLFLWKRRPAGFAEGKPSVAVMHFENNTGDENLDHWRKALSDLLISDLSQSKYISVLSSEELYNILEEKGLLDDKSYSSKALKDIASRAGVKYILLGKMTKAGNTIRIDSQLQNIDSGKIMGSERVEGQGEESFFAMVDDLTPKIKSHFKLSSEEIAGDFDKEAGSITTGSAEAYRYYSEAKKFHNQGDYTNSIALMEMAVGIDPHFAMAYRTMAIDYGNLGYEFEARERLQKAYELRENVSERERYLILGDYYSRSEKTYDKAIEAFNKLLQLYPDDQVGNNNLGEIYRGIEEWDEAIKRYEVNIKNRSEAQSAYGNQAIALMANGEYDQARRVLNRYLDNIADIANLHGILAQSYISQGKFDMATAESGKAFSLDPTHRRNFLIRGDVFTYQGRLDDAEKEYRNLLELKEPVAHYDGLRRMSALAVMQGKFGAARDYISEGIDLAEMLGENDWLSWFILHSAYVFLRQGEFDEALAECKRVLTLAAGLDMPPVYRKALYLEGVVRVIQGFPAEAERIAAELMAVIDEGLNKKDMRFYHHLKGLIESRKKDFAAAVDSIQKAIALLPSPSSENDDHALFFDSLASVFSDSGAIGKARDWYGKMTLLTTGRLYAGDIYAHSFYALGKIDQGMKNMEQAAANYDKFIESWKDTDRKSPELDDARKQLSFLRRD